MTKFNLAAGAAIEHCLNGHLYVGGNVGLNPDGSRQCKSCAEDQKRRETARRREQRAANRPITVLPRMEFVAESACRNADPRLFEPVTRLESGQCGGNPLLLDRVQAALSYCDVCPVRARCGAWAKAAEEQGVWGGEYLSREGRRKKGAA